MPDHPSRAFKKPLAGVAKQSVTCGQQKDAPMTTQKTLEEIARRRLGMDSLETRKSDRLDFHEVAVWNIVAALQDAYEAGKTVAAKNGGAA
jgi:hypothetical protein